VVLLDAYVEGYVIRLGPAAERGEIYNRLLVAPLEELPAAVVHEPVVGGVGGVTGLESDDSVGATLGEFSAGLGRGQTEFIEAVVVDNALEELDLATKEEVAGREDVLGNPGVLVVSVAEHTGNEFFLAVDVDFGVAEDGDVGAVGGDEGDGILALDGVLDLGSDGESDGNRHGYTLESLGFGVKVVKVSGLVVKVGVASEVHFHGVEVEDLEKNTFTHETAEGGGPAFTDSLKPLKVNDTKRDLGEAGSLGSLFGEGAGVLGDEFVITTSGHAVRKGEAVGATVAFACLTGD
jgi:hypothetical protein